MLNVQKRATAIIAALALLAVMTGCGEPAAVDATPLPENATTVPALTTPSATLAQATLAPTPTHAITPEPVLPPPDIDVQLSGGFKALAKSSEVVLLGTFKKVNGIVNMAPDPNNKMKIDMTLLPTDYKHDGKRAYMGEYQLEFSVETVYKGKVKKNDTLIVHLKYEYQMKDRPLGKEELFLLPELDKQCIMFMSKDVDFDIYAPDVEPHMFYLTDNVLHIATADKAIETTWENGAGVTGISLDAFKKELGVK